MFRTQSLCSAVALAVGLNLGAAAPAESLTMKDCSAKYQEAKKADTLKGMKWTDFRKAECADGNASEAAAKKDEPRAAPESARPATEKPSPAPTSAAAGAASFPNAVASKYSGETSSKARMHTCLDQYRANKASGAQQPRWIEKGGGYYSQCNAKLKNGGA